MDNFDCPISKASTLIIRRWGQPRGGRGCYDDGTLRGRAVVAAHHAHLLMKPRVAVFFGGRSPEHDISILTGLQALDAIDQTRYSSFPVYVSLTGNWLVGEKLRERATYIPWGPALEQFDSVTLDVRPNVEGRGRLLASSKGLFSKSRVIEFDIALLAFHGLQGEDGCLQGLLEVANVPYTGMRVAPSALCMDKQMTKFALHGSGISLLPSISLERPASGMLPNADEIRRRMGSEVDFPAVVKPAHLGSSIGVARATSVEEVRAVLPPVFKLDTHAIIEPFVQNLAEYNIAVRKQDGKIMTSAIEKPKSSKDLLDFKEKYLSGTKTGKLPGTSSEGMLSLTREINPPLDAARAGQIRSWAQSCFERLGGSGAPRIDFLADEISGEIWLNEVNPCPGSFGYFLWEAAQPPILFSDLLSGLLEEATALHRRTQLPPDPTDPGARLFSRP